MQAINPPGWLRAPGWSHAMLEKVGDRTYLKIAGQVGWDMTTQKLVSDDLEGQYDQALANLCTLVREAGGEPNNIIELRIYVTSVDEFNAKAKQLGQIYRNHLGKHFPAITLLGVNQLFMKELKIEIEALAII